jgi:hypothetical protein
MSITFRRICTVIATLTVAGTILWAQPAATNKTHSGSMDHLLLTPNDLAWTDGPPSLPLGARMAVLEGDPAAPGSFTIRLKLPANYEIQPYFCTAIERLTVISGRIHVGLGDALDRAKARALSAGGFAVMNVGTKHYVFTSEETIVQLHGMGPWGITYVDPGVDPRNRK